MILSRNMKFITFDIIELYHNKIKNENHKETNLTKKLTNVLHFQ